jgi:hypothetical protein
MGLKKVFYESRYNSMENLFDKLGEFTQGNYQTVQDYEECDIYVAYDLICEKDIKDRVEYVLIRNEPSIVLPQNYKHANLKLYDTIIDIGKIDDGSKTTLYAPQNLNLRCFDQDNRSDKIVLVNRNLLCLRKGELYSLRRAAIYGIKDIALYGHGWNINIFRKIKIILIEVNNIRLNPSRLKIKANLNFLYNSKKYLGAPTDKILCMSGYKYALIIENSLEYMSEKLFDALVAGCIPIYVGIDPEKFGIPNNLVFWAQPTIPSISNALLLARKIDYNKWKVLCRNWLQDVETANKWADEYFAYNLTKTIFK